MFLNYFIIVRNLIYEEIKGGKLFKIWTLQKVTEDFWLASSPRKCQNPIEKNIMENFKWKS